MGPLGSVPEGGTVAGQRYWCVPGGESLFADVDPADMFCKHIHFMVRQNVDLGCDPRGYCPGDKLTRLQMAAFVAKALWPAWRRRGRADELWRSDHRFLRQL